MFALGVAIYGRGAFVAWREERARRIVAEANLVPRVTLVHEFEGAPNYLRTANIDATTVERRHIIGVVNLSAAEIPQLRVVAVEFEPYVQGATWVDAPMHPLRTEPNRDGLFNLSIGDGSPTRFVEIFQELVFFNGDRPAITMVYDQTGLQQLKRFIVGDWFALTLRVQGNILPQRIRLVAKRNPETNRFDVRASDEIRPAGSACQLAVLTSGQVPRAEPRDEPLPSPAPGPDD